MEKMKCRLLVQPFSINLNSKTLEFMEFVFLQKKTIFSLFYYKSLLKKVCAHENVIFFTVHNTIPAFRWGIINMSDRQAHSNVSNTSIPVMQHIRFFFHFGYMRVRVRICKWCIYSAFPLFIVDSKRNESVSKYSDGY